MKKFISGLLFGIIISVSVSVGANNEILAKFAQFNFIVDGKEKSVEQSPIVINGSSYLPVRSIANMLGFDVTYKADSRTIEFNNDNNSNNDKEPINEIPKNSKDEILLNSGETYEHDNIKVTVYDFIRKDLNYGGEKEHGIEYKIKLELSSDTILNGTLFIEKAITNNEKYNKAPAELKRDWNGRIDFGETKILETRQKETSDYKVEYIEISIPSLNIENIKWAVN